MAKIGKPRGLIDYFALSDEPAERAGGQPKPVWKHVLRPRTILYTSLWSLVGAGLVFALFIRSPIDMTVAPVRNPTFVTLSDGTIRNAYDIRLRNMQNDTRPFMITVGEGANLQVGVEGSDTSTVTVPADESMLVRVYVSAAPDNPAAQAQRTAFRFWIEDVTSGSRAYVDTHFNGKDG